MMLFDSQQAIS